MFAATSGYRSILLLLSAASLLLLPGAAMGDSVSGDPPEGYRNWELGLGYSYGWAEFREAGLGDVMTLSSKPGQGIVVRLCWRLSPRVGLEAEVGAQNHETSLAGVTGIQSLIVVGFRYQPELSGGILPYLRGSYGGAGMELKSDSGESESLVVRGMAGLMGLGVRLAFSPRLQFDLELNHAVINYRDTSVSIESVYIGNRIDKAGSITRLQLVAVLLF